MKYMKVMILAPAIMLAAACHRNDDRAAADTALKNDLSLANQVAPSQDTISATESGYAPAPNANTLRSTKTSSPTRTASRSTSTRSSTSARRTSTRRRSSGSSSSGGTVYSSSGGNVSTSAPAPTVVKHTKRDAAIGAAAGAVIGATTSRDKLKGAIVGGVVGGVLGGVIGNNVDKTKKP